MVRLPILALALIVLFGTAGCKAKEDKGKSEKDAAEVSPSPSPASSSSPTTEPEDTEDDCDKTSDADEEGDDLSLRGKNKAKGFKLASDVTYEDVAPIFESKCLSCHAAGATKPAKPDLSTYAKAKAKATAIKNAIVDGSMPPSGKLSSSDKTKIKDWVAGGMLEQGSDQDDDEMSGGGSDCDDTDESKEDVDDSSGDRAEILEELLNPAKLKECKDQGLVYDRGKDACHISTIATFDCSIDGITKKFKEVGVTLRVSGGKVAGFEDYEIDQCGEHKKEPVIFFYKKVDDVEGEVTLKIKILCKAGSAACVR